MSLLINPYAFVTPAGGGGGSLSFEADIIHWWDAQEGVTTTGSDVDSWADKIGGVLLSPADASNKPAFNATGINGEPSIDMLGADKGMTAPFVSSDSTCTFILVGNHALLSSAGNGRILSVHNPASSNDYQANGSFALTRNLSGSDVTLYRGGGNTGSCAANYNTTRVFLIDLNGTDTDFYMDDTAQGSRAVSAALASTQLGLFREIAGSGFEDAKGQAGDLMVVNRSLSSAERTEVYDFMVAKYGL